MHTLHALVILHVYTHAVRIAESREAGAVDYTGQIRQFSNIGPSGPLTVTPRPWVCYVEARG